MTEKTFLCPHCAFTTDKDSGWRKHMSMSHGGYHKHELEKAGIEENQGDRIRYLSGFRNLDEVRAAAPETEGEGQAPQVGRGPTAQRVRVPRLTKEEQQKAAEDAEFQRLKPVLVKKWNRRLRMLYGVWARLADDEKIKLSDDEADEGSEMHVELMQAFGWIHAGKIEAIADLLMWHGAMILSRSELGSQLLAQFHQNPQQSEQVQ